MGRSNWLHADYGENEHGHFVHVLDSRDGDWETTLPGGMDEDDIAGDPDLKWVDGEGAYYISQEAAKRGFLSYCEYYEQI